jgi:CO/xanthine dehydrogenase FAD-binding subunit
MRDFAYQRATTTEGARQAVLASGMLLAGGTSLLDLAKCGVAQPASVIDITRIPGMDAISVDANGALIGALATMSRVAADAHAVSRRDGSIVAGSVTADPQHGLDRRQPDAAHALQLFPGSGDLACL